MSRRVAVTVGGAVLAASVVLPAPPAMAAGVSRSSGADRIGTAVAASRDHVAAAETAVLATAGSFTDALGATALAGRRDAPLLLVGRDQLDDRVAGELERLGVSRVTLLGGNEAIGAGVEEALVARGYVIERIAGSDRWSTAAAIARATGPAPTGEVVVALGSHPDPAQAWPDALAGGALSATPDHPPLLLTNADELPEATERALQELASRAVVVGGEGTIGAAVVERIESLGVVVERIAGGDRYATSAAVAAVAADRFPAPASPVLTSGSEYADALGAAALAAAVGGPLLLVPPADLVGPSEDALRVRAGRWGDGIVVGGPVAVEDFVVEQAAAAIDGRPAPERPVPPPPAEPEPRVLGVFEGQASWYGPGFAGNRTACGNRFDPGALTAAHRRLPCGTRLRVTNTANGAQVVVTVNDRGPYSGGRVLDLAERAAADLGFRGQGHTHVRAEILEG